MVEATVLIAAHNRLPMLKRAVNSALGQQFKSFEVLVINDGSDRPTRRWLDERAIATDKLRVKHQVNKGVAAARQRGLLEARGKWVCILDSDDQLLPHALSRLISIFDHDPSTELVYSNYMMVRTDGSARLVRLPRYSSNRAMIRAIFTRPRVPLKHSGTTFRRETALELGGYDVKLAMKIDIDFFLRFLVAERRLTLLEEPVVRFLAHPHSMSRQRHDGIKVWFDLIDRYEPGRLTRIWYKVARGTAERLKLYYEYMWLK